MQKITFPKTLLRICHISMAIACLLLAAGLVCYGAFAVGALDNWSLSFMFSMTALFFFNLPILLKRHYVRRQTRQQNR